MLNRASKPLHFMQDTSFLTSNFLTGLIIEDTIIYLKALFSFDTIT
jgi:hypothetical protein